MMYASGIPTASISSCAEVAMMNVVTATLR